MTKKDNLKIFNSIGIGIFAFLTIYELTGLIEYLFRQFLFISTPKSLSILWLPQSIGIAVYVIFLLWAAKKLKKSKPIDSSKTLVATLVIFFVLMLVKFLYSMYGTGLLFARFPEEFDAFHKLRDENQDLQRLMAFVPTLKYLIAAVFLFLNRKAVSDY